MELFALVSREECLKTGLFQVCRFIENGKKIEIVCHDRKLVKTADKYTVSKLMPMDEVIRRGLEYGRDYAGKFDLTEAKFFSDKPFNMHEYFLAHVDDVKY